MQPTMTLKKVKVHIVKSESRSKLKEGDMVIIDKVFGHNVFSANSKHRPLDENDVKYRNILSIIVKVDKRTGGIWSSEGYPLKDNVKANLVHRFHLHVSDKFYPTDDEYVIWKNNKAVNNFGMLNNGDTKMISTVHYHFMNNDIERLIASTDKTLKLPGMSNLFLENFIFDRNQGLSNLEYLVDYGFAAKKVGINHVHRTYFVKTDFAGNVLIQNKKNDYTKEKAIVLAKKAYNEALRSVGYNEISFGDWFEKWAKKKM